MDNKNMSYKSSAIDKEKEFAEEYDRVHNRFIQSEKYAEFLREEIPRTLQAAYLFLDKHPDNTYQNRERFMQKITQFLIPFGLTPRQISRLGNLMWGDAFKGMRMESKRKAINYMRVQSSKIGVIKLG